MISKAQIKQVRLLHQKKYRDEQGLFIAEGPKIVNELLNSKYKVKGIYATAEYSIRNTEDRVQKISEKELESISSLTTSNQVLGVFEIPASLAPRPSSLASGLVLALDDIRDPGNLGTIIRIADWFGINHVLCSDTCVDVFNPKVIQATMGSIVRVDVYYVNLASLVEEVRGQRADVKIYGAVMNGKNIYTEKISDKGIILIGNESRGISEKLISHVTQKLSIPNFSSPPCKGGLMEISSGADSLNAAIATAVICSEFRRRKKGIRR